NSGGFSGAGLWRVETSAGAYCLRAWPPAGSAPDRLRTIHGLLRIARHKGLEFIPTLCDTQSGHTWLEHAGRAWDVTTWLPGRAAFHERPTPHRLEAACAALAQIHMAWLPSDLEAGPCPAVRRRLDATAEWLALVQSGWRPSFGREADDPVLPWA